MINEISRLNWLNLYKDLIGCSKQFSSYNYRQYALRRVRDHFGNVNNKTLNADQLQKLYEKGCQESKSLHRQVTLSQLYAGPKLIFENESSTKI